MTIKHTVFTAMAAVALFGSGLALAGAPTATPVQAASTTAAQQGGSVTINYVPGYSVAVWTTPNANKKPTGKLIKHGTLVNFTATQDGADGYLWYQIGANQWISGHYAKEAVAVTGRVTANYVPGYSIAIWTSANSNHKLSGKTLKHGASLPFTEETVGDDGATWFKVGANQWVSWKYVGFELDTWHPVTVKIKANSVAQVWNSPLNGHKQLNKALKANTSWKAFKSMEIGNNGWFNLGGNQWIFSNNAVEIH
ncbi:hypothetical protein [Lacticaseibacillus brantae]|uniref:Surface layer protein A domain-containing protein n=1 Tax=Lacticaseibacillus brantae DSM 23927 TaxID=1423727 RepID=A0A0R2B7M3_9LACO|nr:hypothetical protein [Lacticaseibacillus brantae]KRM71635.1 hypothetical protein FC34_GL001292 [Lacticaseibacillus brantae DSM 23927]